MSASTERANHDIHSRTPRDNDAPQLELSVVMPCLNEAETVAACVESALRALAEHSIEGEVVVADNGSHDDSGRIAELHGARVVHVPARGYGNSLMQGIAAARGKFVVMADCDLSYDFAHIPRFVERLRDGDELVMGNRFLGGIAPGAMPFLHRHLGTPAISAIGRMFFGSKCRDFNCGMRGFLKSSIEQLELRCTGMEFATEMVVKAAVRGLRTSEIPTTLAPDGRSRPPHLRTWRDGWRNLRFMLLFSPAWLFFFPGLLLMLVGLGVVGWLLPGQRQVGSLVFGAHTLLYGAAAILVGFQAILFALLGRAHVQYLGLVPESAAWRRFFRLPTLEFGVLIGALLFLVGLSGSAWAVDIWRNRSFGSLEYRDTLRIVIPSVMMLVLGCQLSLSSLFMSVLGLNRDSR